MPSANARTKTQFRFTVSAPPGVHEDRLEQIMNESFDLIQELDAVLGMKLVISDPVVVGPADAAKLEAAVVLLKHCRRVISSAISGKAGWAKLEQARDGITKFLKE